MSEPTYGEFEKLFRQHHKALHNLAYNLVRDKDAAKDVIQEVFTKLWQNRERVHFGDQIKHYLFKATAHTALNHLRGSRKFLPVDQLESFPIPSPSTHHEIDYLEFEAQVQAAIDRLPPRCRTIYLLSRHEGLKYQEIADALDISIKTVENQMGIALEKLREELKPWLPPTIVIAALLSLLYWLIT